MQALSAQSGSKHTQSHHPAEQHDLAAGQQKEQRPASSTQPHQHVKHAEQEQRSEGSTDVTMSDTKNKAASSIINEASTENWNTDGFDGSSK